MRFVPIPILGILLALTITCGGSSGSDRDAELTARCNATVTALLETNLDADPDPDIQELAEVLIGGSIAEGLADAFEMCNSEPASFFEALCSDEVRDFYKLSDTLRAIWVTACLD